METLRVGPSDDGSSVGGRVTVLAEWATTPYSALNCCPGHTLQDNLTILGGWSIARRLSTNEFPVSWMSAVYSESECGVWSRDIHYPNSEAQSRFRRGLADFEASESSSRSRMRPVLD
jgi:hypothetical protein